jgi:hypothetical protein
MDILKRQFPIKSLIFLKSNCHAKMAPDSQIGAARQSAVDKSKVLIGPSLLLHHPFSAVLLEQQADSVNDLLLGMRLAIFDHLVLDFATLLEVGKVLMREAVVPVRAAALPSTGRALGRVFKRKSGALVRSGWPPRGEKRPL